MASLVILPKLTYEMEEGRILEWLCAEGDPVSAGQILFVVETDKASVEVPADESGTLLKVLAPVGETVPVSAPVAWIGAPGEAIPEAAAPQQPETLQAPLPPPAAPTVPEPAEPTDKQAEVAASPVARRLARELGVDLAEVQARVGPRRIREADIRAHAEARSSAVAAPEPQPQIETEFELQTPSPLQRSMAAHLRQAAAIPQFAAAREVNLTNLQRLRGELLEGWEAAHGFRLSYTHLLAVVTVRALQRCPTLNASWTESGIRLYRRVHLGVAMASDRGLVVPVVHNAHRLSLPEMATELVRLQRATERNRLLPTDLQGGTFTMTNVGMLGIELSIPLLNPPQSAILGIGAERSQVRLEENRLWASPVTWITVVCDHRLVDGAASAEFLKQVKGLIEDPNPVFCP